MAQVPVTVPPKRLSVAITSAATSFQLNNIKGWNGSDLTSSDLGDRAWAVFLNSDKTIMEIMRIDPSTIASASITITKRGLDFKGGDSEVTANKLNWNAGETTVLLGTNPPQLYEDYMDLYDAQTVAGKKTFSTVPAASADAVDNNDLVRKSQLDAAVLGSTLNMRLVVPAIAGETIADGNLVYFDDTENEWMKCDADTAASVENVLLGIAQGAGTNGNTITNGVLLFGVDDAQSGMTIGDKQFASNTAGGISSSAGTKEVTVGWAKSATELYFSPRFDQQITEDIQDALAATSTPSGTNKFITQKDLQIGAEKYAADAAGSDTYAITLSPAPDAYVNGMEVNFKAQTANTGPATLNVNSLGAVDITKHHDKALETGDIEANQIVTVIYNSSTAKFQMVGHTALEGNKTLARDPNTTTTGGTTNETTVATFAVPAGTLGTTRAIRIKAHIRHGETGNAGDYTYKFKYGATTLITLAVAHGDGSNSNWAVMVEAVLYADGATNSQYGSMCIIAQQISKNANQAGGGQVGTGTAAEDSTAEKTIALTITSASASHTASIYGTTIELI